MGAASQLAFDLDASAAYYAASITQDRIAPHGGRRRKFNVEQECTIRSEFADGQTQKALALKHGVSQPTIGKVLGRGQYQGVVIPPAAPERGRLVKIPRMASRSEQFAYAKLLCKVDPRATDGLGFEGVLLRPGRTIEESELWPTPKYPKVPVLLEYAGKRIVEAYGESKALRMGLYLIWRYERPAWIQIARAHASGTEWAIQLRSVAISQIALSNGAAVDVLPSLDAIAERVRHEFESLEVRDRCRLIGLMHDYFAAQLVAIDQRELTA